MNWRNSTERYGFLSNGLRWTAALTLVACAPTAWSQMFESDSKRYGNPKMDIVVKEVERRPRASVLDIKVTAVGSSVGASFFLVCSIRQLARQRGGFRYIAKLEETPQRGQMLVGFLHSTDEPPSGTDPAFAAAGARTMVADLDQFAEICDRL